MKEYKAAVDNLDKATTINRTGLRRFYVYRGLANLELKNIDQAVKDLEDARTFDDTSYEVNLGLVRAYYLQEKFGSAFLMVDVLKSLAETDQEIAVALYWRALIQEKRDEAKDAIKAWKALLAMDADVMTPKMRSDAEQHLKNIVIPTNTPKGVTKTPTAKAGGSVTVTATPKAGTTPSRTPTRTPTP